jgi:hypothetical protein
MTTIIHKSANEIYAEQRSGEFRTGQSPYFAGVFVGMKSAASKQGAGL